MNSEFHSTDYYMNVPKKDLEVFCRLEKSNSVPYIFTEGQANQCISIKQRPLKRLFDIIFSAFVLLSGAPVYIFIALLIKMTSRGPILYSQERVGRAGKLFRCYKFRTMVPDAEAVQKYLVESDQLLKNEWLISRKLKKDPRVTMLGTFLRRTSLDELPQFWNVLKGDLSVVGPRPVVVDEVMEFFGSKAGKLLSVRPGITGLWQVSGRSDICYAKRLQLDEQYIDEISMILDFKLIVKTIPSMLFSSGAY